MIWNKILMILKKNLSIEEKESIFLYLKNLLIEETLDHNVLENKENLVSSIVNLQKENKVLRDSLNAASKIRSALEGKYRKVSTDNISLKQEISNQNNKISIILRELNSLKSNLLYSNNSLKYEELTYEKALDILNVKSDIKREDLDLVWKSLVKIYHPDGKNYINENKCKEINMAYNYLKNKI